MSFGIRGPGGSRTGSVVAVAMSSPLHCWCLSTCRARHPWTAVSRSGYRVVAQREPVLFLDGLTDRRRPEQRCLAVAVEPVRARVRAVPEAEHRVVEERQHPVQEPGIGLFGDLER